MKKPTLTKVRRTSYACPLCGEEFKTPDEGSEHAKIGLRLPAYYIGDRIKFHTSETKSRSERYSKPEGVVINIMIEEK